MFLQARGTLHSLPEEVLIRRLVKRILASLSSDFKRAGHSVALLTVTLQCDVYSNYMTAGYESVNYEKSFRQLPGLCILIATLNKS